MELIKDNSYLINIKEFTDNNRVHPKKIKAILKNNSDINDSIIIYALAPSLRTTELINKKEADFEHLFLKSSDNKFINIEGKIEIEETNLESLDGYELLSSDRVLILSKEE